MFTKMLLNISANSLLSEITFACKFTFSEKRGFTFSTKRLIVRYVTYFKNTVIGLFLFPDQVSTVITLFVIDYSVGIGFEVTLFVVDYSVGIGFGVCKLIS